jgi:predicted acylesterase/phospholipase RssA
VERQDDLPLTIGLSLSGGGYRAAAFHLGVLMYLDRAGLLDRVRLMSTVSGGTFTGAKYALSCLEKKSPAEFFVDYYDELRKSRIFPQALELLGNKTHIENSSCRKNIITCAAEGYSSTFFCKPDKSGPYLFGDVLNGDTSPLDEITFNATDFRTGLAFRFQKSERGHIGNFQDRIRREDAERMCLGDIVAASSCFPGGFEPLEFPNDFFWHGGLPGEVAKHFYPPSPLMDGGVYDNQGLESLLLAEDRIGDADVLIISDTDRQEDEHYRLS